jgi:catechol 2,3-dioxygenase-like lactoylglutathione lyase family enzyme
MVSFIKNALCDEPQRCIEANKIRKYMANKKKPKSSALTIAHIVVMVSDLKASCRFYTDLGLAPCMIDGDQVAIIELHGGTHVLLFKSNGENNQDLSPSYTGQFRRRFSEQFDLMIPGRSRKELEAYRQGLIKRGIVAGDIPAKKTYGHYLFCMKDPDGHGITIYTSHRISS